MMGKTGKLVISGGDENKDRGNWSRKLDFTLTCLGYAVGLSNLWRFPYLCMKYGGAAFLIPYFLFLFLCGIPLFFLEMCVGQFASLSPPAVWKLCPLFKGIGYASIIVSFIGSTYYNMILAWALYYLGHSFTGDLPWASCNNSWNTPNCTLRPDETLLSNHTIAVDVIEYHIPEKTFMNDSVNVPVTNIVPAASEKTPPVEFWKFQMLHMTSGLDDMGVMRWQLVLCLGAAWVLIFLCICNGIKSAGKVVYVTVPLPYILLTVLLIRGCMLPGAINGLLVYLVPDLNSLLQFNVWVEACIQVFFSLGPAWGCLITLASYNRFNSNCLLDAMIVPVISCVTSVFAGLVIFSMLGFLANEANLSVKDVIASGPELVFFIYPEALTKLPLAPMWSVLFFIMLLTLGLDTQFALVETVSSGLCDLFSNKPGIKKTIISATLCIAQFVIGLVFTTGGGVYVFELFHWYCGSIALLLIGILECFIMGYMYGLRRLCYDIEMMIGRKDKVWWIWWKVCWWIITPAMLMVTLVMTCITFRTPFYSSYKYNGWAVGIGWVIAVLPLLPIPLVMIAEIIRARGSLGRRIRYLLVPETDWGPALDNHKANYAYGRDSKYRPVSPHGQEGKYMLDHSPV